MIDKNKILVVIPARGGSKGIPYKNIKPLAGKPLIYYSIDIAREITSDENICVSTDDDKIVELIESYGLKVPFKRPDFLSTDTSTTHSVLIHALNFYESLKNTFDIIVLLQPTSPIRSYEQVISAISLYDDQLDMVASVKKSHSATVLCKEDTNGYISLTLNLTGNRRQDVNNYYELNGSIYVINVKSLKLKGMSNFSKIRKYVMDEISSIDIDTEFDWQLAEFYIRN